MQRGIREINDLARMKDGNNAVQHHFRTPARVSFAAALIRLPKNFIAPPDRFS
ncbi:hypothetical protein [Aquamicrobium sp. LC103]|uniref:hypothetical protein n=1 Tax=Aquamicrobium sp. LC103 TaxID=1120658 RepID=UPI001484CE63|nr:hypothetical protein [Aquamicrobium sp. LC103]